MGWLVVLTGVCGSGKSSVGLALAAKEGALFVDGDDYHSSESVGKMSQGQPLTDLERLPWLQSLHGVLYEWARAEDSKEEEGRGEEEGGRVCGVRVCGVLVCSALKRSYRDILIGRGQGERDISKTCLLVQLTASVEVLGGRLEERTDHFMPSSLLSSQLATLEPLGEAEGLTCQASGSPADTAAHICHFLSRAHTLAV